MSALKNAISVDVEDYYQVEAFSNTISRDSWKNYPSRVESNNDKILKIFDEHGVKGTFFILGCVAEKNPSIVKEIHEEGHEVACHGYSHKMILKQTRTEFRAETIKAKSILEDIVNIKVKGYRAATYSITNENLWALEEIANAGFIYDSSIFPIKHDRYGIREFNRFPCELDLRGKKLKEFPITTAKLFGENIPVSGGGYFRLYPYFLTKLGLGSVNKEGMPFVFYLHPWEVDPEQPRVKDISKATRFRHYINLDKTEEKLQRLLTGFKFGRIDKILETMELPRVNIDV